jgi:hypothetical protein
MNCSGVPDTKFPFPFAHLKGVRIAVPNSEKAVREGTSAHLHSLFLQDLEVRNRLVASENGQGGEREGEGGREAEAEEESLIQSISFNDMTILSSDAQTDHIELTFLQSGGCADV